MTHVLVLNASYEPLNVTSVKRAVVLLLKDKAEVIEHDDAWLRSETTTLTRPAVIRLVAYVTIPYTARKRITRRAVFARDGWACQYCGAERTMLTVDHVRPKSKGGSHEWENVVAACSSCNHRKNDLTPRQAGMTLRRIPKAPRSDVVVFVHIKAPPASWQPYLVC